MYTRNLRIITLASMFAVSAVALGAAEAPKATVSKEQAAATATISTDALLGRAVSPTAGYESPIVKELIINRATGRIESVVLTLDAENGSTLSVSWDALNLGDEEGLMLSTAAEAAREAPTANSIATTPQGSYAPRQRATARYDTSSVRHYEGLVVGMVVAPLDGATDDVALLVDVGTGDSIRVHLGPEWYVDRLGVDIDAGDLITFVGSELLVDGETIVLASTLGIDGTEVSLRDTDGAPRW